MRLSDKILEYSSFTDPDECWIWERGTNSVGYGQLRWKGRLWLVHRLVWQLTVKGLKTSDKMDHLCRNTLCFNPDHLEVVDDQTNIRRANGWTQDEEDRWYCTKNHLVEGPNLKLRKGRRESTGTCKLCYNEFMRVSRGYE